MRDTPRIRPSSGPPPASGNAGPRPLLGSALLVWGETALPLREGEHVIGRAPDCDMVLDDPLVSRHHAKIVVGPAIVFVEDLLSANGVYVNGQRVARSQQLFDGDRILIATRELSVFEARSEASCAEPERAPRTQEPNAENAALDTARPDPFAVVGPMADRFLAAGRVAEAARLLADHTNKLIEGARASLNVPPDVCEKAGSYAMKLAKAARQGRFIDQAVELHLRSRRVMAAPVVDLLLEALEVVTKIDVDQFHYYLQVLCTMSKGMNRAELEQFNRLASLTLPSPKTSGFRPRGSR